MTDGPLGGAAFNNEFGRPALGGYFRTYEQAVPTQDGSEVRGYHKPIMIAGSMGNIRAQHVQKDIAEPVQPLLCWVVQRCSLVLAAVPLRQWPAEPVPKI